MSPPTLAGHHGFLALVGFVAAVAVTPPTAWPAFVLYGVVLLRVALAVGATPQVVLPRMAVEVPFVLFAAILPFVATGPAVQVMGLTLAVDGLWAAWGILAKATLGVLAAVLLGLVCAPEEIVAGLQRLRLPEPLVQTAAFMLRYLVLVTDEIRVRRDALRARAYPDRHLGHAVVVARTVGTTFVRTYERGERVHLAMVARGFDGSLPDSDLLTADPESTPEHRLAPAPAAAGMPVGLLVLLAVVWLVAIASAVLA